MVTICEKGMEREPYHQNCVTLSNLLSMEYANDPDMDADASFYRANEHASFLVST